MAAQPGADPDAHGAGPVFGGRPDRAPARRAMKSPWDKVRNILCVRLDSLGDVLMCTPAMRALRSSRPGRFLTLLTSSGGAAAVPFIPEIAGVIEYAAPWMKSGAPQEPAADI